MGRGEGVVQGQYFLLRIRSSGLQPSNYFVWTDLEMRLFSALEASTLRKRDKFENTTPRKIGMRDRIFTLHFLRANCQAEREGRKFFVLFFSNFSPTFTLMCTDSAVFSYPSKVNEVMFAVLVFCRVIKIINFFIYF